MKSIDELHNFGQALWYDNIQRSLLGNGELKAMIERGEIKGVTSNPSIFHNAITKTNDYDETLKPMAWAGLNAEEIFWELAIKDIQEAADLFLPIYRSSHRKDGYVSLEVSPFLAKDTEATICEAKRLWEKVDRPNLMIKIPATVEGIPAIRRTITDGLNVNVTLIFSLKRYQAVIEAFLSGLEARLKAGKGLDHIASVASFFVSRVDTKVDGMISKLIESGSLSVDEANKLFGKAAIANAKLAYQLYKEKFSGERFKSLFKNGAQNQRPLWASTSTKNPNYRDVIYIEELIGAETVNTVPPATLVAYGDHGNAALTIEKDLEKEKQSIHALESTGISMQTVTNELEEEGVKSFADAFRSLLQSVEERRQVQVTGLFGLASDVKKRVLMLQKQDFVKRMVDYDPSLWTQDPKGQDEIRVRMDWLNAPWQSEELLPHIENLLSECRSTGFTHALLLGMGGSSLAPEVLCVINGQSEYRGVQGLDLGVLDSTNPDEVLLASHHFPIETTLFIVASKSGTTEEINAFYQYFWDQATTILGERAGSHFIAITDPETRLEKLAKDKGFWKVFSANPRVGGRNSALTAFGLVPAALIGMNVQELLKRAQTTAELCRQSVPISANPGVVLGAVIAEAALHGRDKLTVVTDRAWSSFGNWLEQLIAESSGKDGKGIVPVANEPRVSATKYGKDRLFVYLRNSGESDTFCDQVRQAGHPVIVFDVETSYDLGSQFYLWEVATATACSILGVNSFDQPDVQDAKTRTRAGIAAYKQTGKLDQGTPIMNLEDGDIFSNQVLEMGQKKSVHAALDLFLQKYLQTGDYVAINAFIPRTPRLEAGLQTLRAEILSTYGNAVTLGFGPRFMHSTGQLHKGGPNSGVFIEITADPIANIEIPGEGLTFGTLQMAQALGDYQALEVKDRRLIRIHLRKPEVTVLLK